MYSGGSFLQARWALTDLLQPLVGPLAKVDRLVGGEPEFAAFAVQINAVSFTFVLMLLRSGRSGYWMYALLPDFAGYSEDTFASQTVFKYLVEAKKLLAPFHIQMQDDGEGGAVYRFYNPSEDYATDGIRIGAIDGNP